MNHSRPRNRFPEAILTNAAVPVEAAARAKQPGVVEALDDGYSDSPACVVGGRGDQGEGVVEMHDMGLRPLQQGSQFPTAIPRPDGPKREGSFLHQTVLVDFSIPAPVLGDHMACFEEQLFLPLDHLVFATWILILVMDKQYPQRLRSWRGFSYRRTQIAHFDLPCPSGVCETQR
jgi:hypothetical protein